MLQRYLFIFSRGHIVCAFNNIERTFKKAALNARKQKTFLIECRPANSISKRVEEAQNQLKVGRMTYILVVGPSVGIPKFSAVLMNFVEGLVALAATGIEMPC